MRAGRDGLGQHIVVNMQACGVWTLMNEQAMPLAAWRLPAAQRHFHRRDRRAAQDRLQMQGRTHIVSCSPAAPIFNSTNAVIAWMKEEGAAPDWLAGEGGLKTLTPGGFMAATAARSEGTRRRRGSGRALLPAQDQERNLGEYPEAPAARRADRHCRRYRRRPAIEGARLFRRGRSSRARTQVHAAGRVRENERDAGRAAGRRAATRASIITKSMAGCWA